MLKLCCFKEFCENNKVKPPCVNVEGTVNFNLKKNISASSKKLEKKYALTLDNYGQSCFVRSNIRKKRSVCKTQMMPPPDHKKL